MSTVKDPVRLVQDPALPESQRALLRHGASLEPPRGAEAAVWQALAGTLGAAAVASTADASAKSSTGTGTSAAAKTASATASKLVAIVLALGALAGLVVLGRRAFVPAKVAAPVVASERGAGPSPAGLRPATSSRSAGRGEDGEDQGQRANEPRPLAPSQPFALAPRERGEGKGEGATSNKRGRTRARPAAAPASEAQPGDETTLLQEARQALHSGDPARALKLLEECRRRFPRVREQERELLTIQALVSAVRGGEARERAAAFLRKYPGSPHAAEIRRLGLVTPESR